MKSAIRHRHVRHLRSELYRFTARRRTVESGSNTKLASCGIETLIEKRIRFKLSNIQPGWQLDTVGGLLDYNV